MAGQDIICWSRRITLLALLLCQLSCCQDYYEATPRSIVVGENECDFKNMSRITGVLLWRDLAVGEMNGDTLDQLIRFIDIKDGQETWSLGLRYPSRRETRMIHTFDVELFAFKQEERGSNYRLNNLPGEFNDVFTLSHFSFGKSGSIHRVLVRHEPPAESLEVIGYLNEKKSDTFHLSLSHRTSFLIFSNGNDFPMNTYATWPSRQNQISRKVFGRLSGDRNFANNASEKEEYISTWRATREVQMNQPLYLIAFEHPFYHGDYFMGIFEDASYAIIKNRRLRPITVPSRKNLPKIKQYFTSNEENVRLACFKELWNEMICRMKSDA